MISIHNETQCFLYHAGEIIDKFKINIHRIQECLEKRYFSQLVLLKTINKIIYLKKLFCSNCSQNQQNAGLQNKLKRGFGIALLILFENY